MPAIPRATTDRTAALARTPLFWSVPLYQFSGRSQIDASRHGRVDLRSTAKQRRNRLSSPQLLDRLLEHRDTGRHVLRGIFRVRFVFDADVALEFHLAQRLEHFVDVQGTLAVDDV